MDPTTSMAPDGDELDSETGTRSSYESASRDDDLASQGGSDLVEDVETFPADQFFKVLEGINKTSWTIQVGALTACLKSAQLLFEQGLRKGQLVWAGTTGEHEQVRRLMHEVVPFAFDKVLDNRALHNWERRIQVDVLAACAALQGLLVARLRSRQRWREWEETVADDDSEEDLEGLLGALAGMFSSDAEFHYRNRAEEVPTRMPPASTRCASPSCLGPGDALALDDLSDDEGGPVSNAAWLCYLVNHFADIGGFDMLLEVLSQPARCSVALLDALLLPACKAIPVLRAEARNQFLQACMGLLAYLTVEIEANLSALVERGRDSGIGQLSALLSTIHGLIVASLNVASAASAVGAVQRQLVTQLLGGANFAAALAAVRETYVLLQHALDLPMPGDSQECMQVILDWMRQEGVVKALLRAHLHQAQYMAQVRSVLCLLAKEGALASEDIELLWAICEKPDAFEAVKANVFALLGELALDLQAPQLDLLFERLQRCAGRPAPDAMRVIDLLRRLAQQDQQGVLAHRVLKLLWALTTAPGAAPEIVRCGALRDALMQYDDSAMSPLSAVYIGECVRRIAGGKGTLAAMHVLMEILSVCPAQMPGKGLPAPQPVAEQLGETGDLLPLVLASLEQHQAQQRAAEAATPVSPTARQQEGASLMLEEYADFFIGFHTWKGAYISADHAMRLWACLVEGAVREQDRELGLKFFRRTISPDMVGALISPDVASQLLSSKITAMEPAGLTGPAYSCYDVFLTRVALWERKLQVAEPVLHSGAHPPAFTISDLQLTGLSYLWRVALDAPQCIAAMARKKLVALHVNLAPHIQSTAPAVRANFLRTCTDALTAAATTSLGVDPADGGVDWASFCTRLPEAAAAAPETALAAQRTARCLQIIQELVQDCQGRTMPDVPVHAVACQGPAVQVEVAAQENRFKLTLRSNSYVGQLRRKVGQQLGVAAPMVRLITNGRELTNDACTLAQLRSSCLAGGEPGERLSLQAAICPVANVFSVLSPEAAAAQKAASPARFLANTEGFYDALLCLADFSPSSEVRRGAAQLLGLLPTSQSVIAGLQAALNHPTDAAGQLAQLLGSSAHGGCANQTRVAKPARLLYTLQALSLLLAPPEGAALLLDAAAAMMRYRLAQFGCIPVVLQAVAEAKAALGTDGDVQSVQMLCSTTQQLITALLGEHHQALAAATAAAAAAAAPQPHSPPLRRPATAPHPSQLTSPSAPDLAHPQAPTSPAPADATARPCTSAPVGQALEPPSTSQTADTAASSGGTGVAPASPSSAPLSPSMAASPAASLLGVSSAPGSNAPPGGFANAGAGSATAGGQSAWQQRSLAASASSWDSGLLREVMGFLMRLAWEAGRGWEDLPQGFHPGPLPASQALIANEAIYTLLKLLEAHPELLPAFLSHPDCERMAFGNLLNPRHDGLRSNAHQFLTRITAWAPPEPPTTSPPAPSQPADVVQLPPHTWLLMRLTAHMGNADAVPACCQEFYDLFCNVVASMRASERDVGNAILDGLVATLDGAVPADGSAALDFRLEGKLKLILVLVRALGRWDVGAASGGGLVKRLVTEYLFPEAVPAAQLAVAAGLTPLPDLQARCSTNSSRQAALELLLELMLHSKAGALWEGTELLMQCHFARERFWNDWDVLPWAQPRAPGGYVGLKNAGATCYMNAVLQQLFMQPSIRGLVLAGAEAAPAARKDSVFYQLQVIFGHLALGKAESYSPDGFWAAFKDYDGEPINVLEHQDAYEFFTRLQDLVDQHLRDARQPPAMQAVIGGKFAQQIICPSVAYRSEKEEEFYQISLDVRGKRTLQESLDSYVQGELMEGDNQYFCERVGKKVDAVKRNCIKALPHTLVVHLKRFEFNYNTMTRWKVKARFEFPEHLDMYVYTVEGLAEAERSEAAAESGQDAAMPGPDAQPRSHYEYELKGVVVHSGTAFAGHYYSYIKERRQHESEASPSGGQWFCFDDNQVTPWDIAQLDVDCYGGTHSVELYNANNSYSTKEYDRPNSAYMLFYERCEALEPAPPPPGCPVTATADAGAPMASAAAAPGFPAASLAGNADAAAPTASAATMSYSPAKAGSPDAMADDGNSAESLQRAGGGAADSGAVTSDLDDVAVVPDITSQAPSPSPQVPAALPPSVYQQVLQTNLRDIEELHMLDRNYFRFIRRLVEGNIEACSRKARRTGPATSAATAGGMGGSYGEAAGGASRRAGEDTERIARATLELTLHFLFKVYLRSHHTLRDDSHLWLRNIAALLEANPEACLPPLFEFFQQKDAGGAGNGGRKPHFHLKQFLLMCPLDAVRCFTLQVASTALRVAVRDSDGAVTVSATMPYDTIVAQQTPGSTAAAVALMFDQLAWLLASPPHAKARHAQLLMLFKEYANLKESHVTHLLAVDVLPWLLEHLARPPPQRKLDRAISDTTAAALLLPPLLRRVHWDHGPTRNPFASRQQPAWSLEAREYGHIYTRATVAALTALPQVEDAGVRELLCFLAWDDGKQSPLIYEALLGAVAQASAEDVAGLAPALAATAGIRDAYLKDRVDWIVARQPLSSAEPLPLLMQANTDVSEVKQLALLETILQIGAAFPTETKAALMAEHAQELWHDAVLFLRHHARQRRPRVGDATAEEEAGWQERFVKAVESAQQLLPVEEAETPEDSFQ